MQRQRGELVPIGEVVADLDGPVKAIRYGQGSVVMTWAAPNTSERQGVLLLGEPIKNFVEYDGLYVVRRDLPP